MKEAYHICYQGKLSLLMHRASEIVSKDEARVRMAGLRTKYPHHTYWAEPHTDKEVQ